jgi:hypothetical protein
MLFGHRSRNMICRIRAIHNVAKGPKVNVILDGKIALSDVAYKTISNYLRISAGNHNLSIVAGDNLLASLNLDLRNGKDYTFIVHGNIQDLSSISILPLKDNNSCAGPHKSHVRFVHAAATVPAVDIWVNTKNKVFSNVSYGETGNPVYLSVNKGDISLSVTPANTDKVVLGPLPLNLKGNTTYTIIASGLLNDLEAPLTALVVQDNSCH